MKYHFPSKKPTWWPEGEPWPPNVPASRGRFMRRMGCLLVLFNFLVLAVLLLLGGAVAHVFGLWEAPKSIRWVVPFGALLAAGGFILVFLLARRMRRMSRPFQSLFDASGRVAAGDFSARAEERGFPEVRSLARAFNSMAERLQVTEEQRRALLAEITHELRTPLTVIQGNLEGMLDGVYPSDEAHLQAILEETRLLARLVDDLRTLALAESGALPLHKEVVDVGLLVEATVSAFGPQAGAAGMKLRIANLLNSETTIHEIDPERTKEVLVNLLANALRYTPDGGEVEVRLGAQAAGGKLWLEVRDNGTGIAPEDLPHIFERFYKGRDSRGTGLGLSIAKKLVEAHGGTIRAESNPQGGTTIRIDDL